MTGLDIGRQTLTGTLECRAPRGGCRTTGSAHDAVAGANSETDLGERRKEGHDAVAEHRADVPTCDTQRVTDTTTESPAQHHPSRRGPTGGANETFPWLRAIQLAFRLPQWH